MTRALQTMYQIGRELNSNDALNAEDVDSFVPLVLCVLASSTIISKENHNYFLPYLNSGWSISVFSM